LPAVKEAPRERIGWPAVRAFTGLSESILYIRVSVALKVV